MRVTEKAYIPRWSKGVTPNEWRQRLLTLPLPVRHAAARIVWWETLSLRMHSDRDETLDDMLKHGPEVPDQDLQAALIKIGLPQAFVMRRITAVKPRPPRRKRPIT
jgi:hypothetical protein